MFEINDNLYEALCAANEKYQHENTDGLSVNLLEGIAVDLFFSEQNPMIGDLLTLCGLSADGWDTEWNLTAEECSHLNIEQIDDIYGIRGEDDVIVWIKPGKIGVSDCFRESGPFDYLTISFNVLRNHMDNSNVFFDILESLCEMLPVTMWKRNLDDIKELTTQMQDDLLQLGIEPGSDEALEIDF